MPVSPEADAAQFFDRFADRFDTLYDGQRNGFMRWIDRRLRSDMFVRFAWTFERMGPLAGKSVVDIGCGSGPYLVEAIRRKASGVTGVDPAPGMLDLARERLSDAGIREQAELIEGFFPEVTVAPHDHAIVMGVFDYLHDPGSFLQALRVCVRESAQVSFPSHHWFRTPIRSVRYRLRNCPVFFFDPQRVEDLARAAGFGTVEIRKIPGAGMDYHVCLQAMNPQSPAITIDVEDWPQSTWDRSLPISQRAADNANYLLDLLAGLDVRATMFVLGKFARRHGDVVRRMVAEGHEIASHGDGHVEVHGLTRDEFARDLKESKSVLQDIIGESIQGYRAPDFSIGRDNLWALDVLAEAGFTYDSSIFPIRNPRYGVPDWPRGPVRVQTQGGAELMEFPIATLRFLGRNWPLGGGGYQRLLPGPVFRMLAATTIGREPFVFYCHPYEFDPNEFDELDFDVPARIRLHQGLGRRRVAGRFVSFVRRFGGCRLIDLCGSRDWPVYCP